MLVIEINALEGKNGFMTQIVLRIYIFFRDDHRREQLRSLFSHMLAVEIENVGREGEFKSETTTKNFPTKVH